MDKRIEFFPISRFLAARRYYVSNWALIIILLQKPTDNQQFSISSGNLFLHLSLWGYIHVIRKSIMIKILWVWNFVRFKYRVVNYRRRKSGMLELHNFNLLTQLVAFCLRSRRRCCSFGPGPARKALTRLRVFSRWLGATASTWARYFCIVVSSPGTGNLGRGSSLCEKFFFFWEYSFIRFCWRFSTYDYNNIYLIPILRSLYGNVVFE